MKQNKKRTLKKKTIMKRQFEESKNITVISGMESSLNIYKKKNEVEFVKPFSINDNRKGFNPEASFSKFENQYFNNPKNRFKVKVGSF